MKNSLRTSIAASVCMLLVILDTRTAITGAQEGLQLCVTTVIPSLLPFIFLSSLLTSAMSGSKNTVLHTLCKIMRIPQGSERIFLTGLLGGYPTGAQAVAYAYSEGQLTGTDARRMLGFCSNAGPSFLFGITGSLFSSWLSPWILWLIHISAAILTATILPGGNSASIRLEPRKPLTMTQAMRQSIAIMAQICGWILLFRICLSYLNRWVLWLVGNNTQILIDGIAELTIGCTSLNEISCEGLRFVFCSAFLGFGGLCVAMQTASVVNSLGLGMYIPGKLTQCIISILFSTIYQQIVFLRDNKWNAGIVFYAGILLIFLVLCFFLRKTKNKSSIPTAVGV